LFLHGRLEVKQKKSCVDQLKLIVSYNYKLAVAVWSVIGALYLAWPGLAPDVQNFQFGSCITGRAWPLGQSHAKLFAEPVPRLRRNAIRFGFSAWLRWTSVVAHVRESTAFAGKHIRQPNN
jgi:hypothetical protein